MSGSSVSVVQERVRTSGDPEPALRAPDGVERVTIEAIHVGDHVLLDPHARPGSARCVIRKHAKANERTARIVGWLLELAGGQLAWWPRGTPVWRRRVEAQR